MTRRPRKSCFSAIGAPAGAARRITAAASPRSRSPNSQSRAVSLPVRRVLPVRPPRHLRAAMTASRRRIGHPAGFIVAGLLAGCQPLPHPFADDRPPAELLAVRDSAGISIAPIEGGPEAATAKLGAALASALLKREIPASDRTTSLGSYQLYGHVAPSDLRDGKPAIVANW